MARQVPVLNIIITPLQRQESGDTTGNAALCGIRRLTQRRVERGEFLQGKLKYLVYSQ